MATSEIIWSGGLLAVLLAALFVLKRVRRGTRDQQQSAAFKERLPAWVRQLEALAFVACLGASGVGVAWLVFRLSGAPATTSGAAAIYFATGAMLIAIPVGALAANLLSWLLPPVRAANERAMAGLQVTFWSANRGLLYFGAVSVPAGAAILAMAALAPWRG